MFARPKAGVGLPLCAWLLPGVLLAAALLMMVGDAWAEPATTCVKATKVKPPKPAKPH